MWDSTTSNAHSRGARTKECDAPVAGRMPSFTLIELLVVIAIIAILASMLLPALQNARATSKSVVCVSQQKQIGTAFALYQDANAEWFPPAYPHSGLYWVNFVQPHLGENGTTSKFTKGTIFLCPAREDQRAVTSIRKREPSYGYNGNSLGDLNDNGHARLTNIRKNTEHLLTVDTVRVDAAFLDDGWFTTEPQGNSRPSSRHPGKRCNVLYADLHVAGYSAYDLNYGQPHATRWSTEPWWYSCGQ